MPKASLQVLSKQSALDMTGNAIDYVVLELICISDMNWHNVISQLKSNVCSLEVDYNWKQTGGDCLSSQARGDG